MKITNIKTMIQVRNYYLKELGKVLNELEITTNNKRKRELKAKKNKFNKVLEEIEKIMILGSKFKTEDFAHFLTRFLTLTEENYMLTKLTLTGYYPYTTGGFVDVQKTYKKDYCFVSNEEDREYILEIDDIDEADEFINSDLSNQVFVLNERFTYPFRYDFKLKKIYEQHPRLKTAIYELIQLKIDNPNLTDKERFEIVLENTLRRNLKHNMENTLQKKKI